MVTNNNNNNNNSAAVHERLWTRLSAQAHNRLMPLQLTKLRPVNNGNGNGNGNDFVQRQNVRPGIAGEQLYDVVRVLQPELTALFGWKGKRTYGG